MPRLRIPVVELLHAEAAPGPSFAVKDEVVFGLRDAQDPALSRKAALSALELLRRREVVVVTRTLTLPNLSETQMNRLRGRQDFSLGQDFKSLKHKPASPAVPPEVAIHLIGPPDMLPIAERIAATARFTRPSRVLAQRVDLRGTLAAPPGARERAVCGWLFVNNLAPVLAITDPVKAEAAVRALGARRPRMAASTSPQHLRT